MTNIDLKSLREVADSVLKVCDANNVIRADEVLAEGVLSLLDKLEELEKENPHLGSSFKDYQIEELKADLAKAKEVLEAYAKGIMDWTGPGGDGTQIGEGYFGGRAKQALKEIFGE